MGFSDFFSCNLKSYDRLAGGISFKYRGSGTFGTKIGGFASIIIRLVIFCFVLSEIYALIWQPRYRQGMSEIWTTF